MKDPISILESVINEAKLARKWSSMLTSARRIDENDTVTLDRILRERREVVDLLHELHEDHDPFDYKFVHGPSLAARIRRRLGMADKDTSVYSVESNYEDTSAARFAAIELDRKDK